MGEGLLTEPYSRLNYDGRRSPDRALFAPSTGSGRRSVRRPSAIKVCPLSFAF